MSWAASLLLASSLLAGTPAAPPSTPEWGWPLPGSPVVDRPFQPPASAWGAGHRGVDLQGYLDEPVLSAGPGRVTYAGVLAGRGVVTVTHARGLRTTYEPVDATVRLGAVVRTGDVLGTLGTGHASCRLDTVCLHWGLLRGRTYLDPLGLVSAGRLRLLPINASPPRPRETEKPKEREKTRKEDPRNNRGLRDKVVRAAKKVAHAGTRVVKATGRVVVKVAKVTGRVVLRLGKGSGRLLARLGSRALPYLVRAAPVAGELVPYVAVGVLVIGGVIWYVRRRNG